MFQMLYRRLLGMMEWVETGNWKEGTGREWKWTEQDETGCPFWKGLTIIDSFDFYLKGFYFGNQVSEMSSSSCILEIFFAMHFVWFHEFAPRGFWYDKNHLILNLATDEHTPHQANV